MALQHTSTLREHNITCIERECYDPDSRLVSFLTPNRSYNQYNKPNMEDALKFTYIWMVHNSKISGECWLLEKQKGVDITINGYTRIALLGNKVLGHVLVYLYHHPGEETEDISHICFNRNCIRP